MYNEMSYFLLLICGTLPLVYSSVSIKQSVKSGLFEPLRPKTPPKSISADCGSVVTEAYGVLEKTYKSGEVKDGSKCTWLLRAPANHVVNIVSVGFDLQDKTTDNSDPINYGSRIAFHDKSPIAPNGLTEFLVTAYDHVTGAFQASTSSKEELEVEITYHDNKDYATQKIFITYEFLNVDEMRKILQG